MQTTTQTATSSKRHDQADDDRAFFYVDGLPTKGLWLDLESVDDWSDVQEALHRAGLIGAEYGGDILVADIEGAIARCCYTSRCDLLDLAGYVELRDVIYQHDFDKDAVAAFIGWYGSWGTETFEDAYMGRYDSEQAYAEQYIDDTGMLSEMPENLQCYFDIEHFASDLFMGDYYFDDGYVFCTNG